MAAKSLDFGAPILFITSAFAVIPFAELVGRFAEVLAKSVGGSKGALLNATLGHLPGLLIAARLAR